MDRDELEQQLADYLTGEMPAVKRAEFERQVAQDPGLARELAELGRAQAMVAGVQVPARESSPPAARRWRHAFVFRLATAAAIVLAFLGGFATRSLWPAGREGPTASNHGGDTLGSEQAVITALQATPSNSDLARSLIALGALQGRSGS